MPGRLEGQRVVVTRCADYMGPATVELFREEGAEVIADSSDLRPADAAAALIERCSPVDILVANLAADAGTDTAAIDIDDAQWALKFDLMVHPLHRLVRAVLPQMRARRRGKVVVYGSASGLRSVPGVAAYSAARAAQIGYVRAVGAEVAKDNVQINLIAQNFVENPAYYPPGLAENPRFLAGLAKIQPAGRLATAREDAQLALFLAGGESDFIVGQAIPFAGGWVQ